MNITRCNDFWDANKGMAFCLNSASFSLFSTGFYCTVNCILALVRLLSSNWKNKLKLRLTLELFFSLYLFIYLMVTVFKLRENAIQGYH